MKMPFEKLQEANEKLYNVSENMNAKNDDQILFDLKPFYNVMRFSIFIIYFFLLINVTDGL